MSKRVSIVQGDVYRMKLPNGKWAYAQFIQKNDRLGYLIRVLDCITSEPISDVASLESSGNLFPPVFVGLLATLRSGRWIKIGNFKINNLKFPLFRSTFGTKPGIYHEWYLWDGEMQWRIGDLPQHLRSLELEQVWGDEGLEERIVAGTYRGDLMF